MSTLAMWQPIKIAFAVLVTEQGQSRLIGTYLRNDEAMRAAQAYYQANPKGEVVVEPRAFAPAPRLKIKVQTLRGG